MTDPQRIAELEAERDNLKDIVVTRHGGKPVLTVRREVLEQLFDMATSSMDFGSGFLDTPQVLILVQTARLLGVEETKAIPPDWKCAGCKQKWEDHNAYRNGEAIGFDAEAHLKNLQAKLAKDYPQNQEYHREFYRDKLTAAQCPGFVLPEPNND